ncbi:MAG TPA: YfhO family protein, partial [Geobacteraceae bacterium]
FTQTTDYMGLLPWLLLPLPLVFRRDRYTWLASSAIVFGILFSMGRYTPFYWFLYEHFPGISHFRVPKMMMFLPVLGLGVLAARGLDLLCDADVRRTTAFRRYLAGLLALPAVLLLFLGAEVAGKSVWLQALRDLIAQPNRFEMGPELIAQRWHNLVTETGIAVGVAAIYAGALIFAARSRDAARLLPLLLIPCYLADTGRVNGKFMLLQPLPHREMEAKTPAIAFLAQQSKEYRTLPMNGADPMKFVANNVPVFFTSNPIQMQRWQNYLDTFTLTSAMPDIMNVKYLVVGRDQLEQVKGELGAKFSTVLQSPDGSEIVLENRSVLPKAWLVPAAQVASDPLIALRALQNPAFDPRRVALVESPPPLPLPPESVEVAGGVTVNRYEGNVMKLTAATPRPALLVVGEKYARGWRATVDGRKADIYPVDYVLRGVYLPPGNHTVEFVFDPLPSKVGKYLTLASFALFALLLVREGVAARRRRGGETAVSGAE